MKRVFQGKTMNDDLVRWVICLVHLEKSDFVYPKKTTSSRMMHPGKNISISLGKNESANLKGLMANISNIAVISFRANKHHPKKYQFFPTPTLTYQLNSKSHLLAFKTIGLWSAPGCEADFHPAAVEQSERSWTALGWVAKRPIWSFSVPKRTGFYMFTGGRNWNAIWL